jgi:hypothetical protein
MLLLGSRQLRMHHGAGVGPPRRTRLPPWGPLLLLPRWRRRRRLLLLPPPREAAQRQRLCGRGHLRHRQRLQCAWHALPTGGGTARVGERGSAEGQEHNGAPTPTMGRNGEGPFAGTSEGWISALRPQQAPPTATAASRLCSSSRANADQASATTAAAARGEGGGGGVARSGG